MNLIKDKNSLSLSYRMKPSIISVDKKKLIETSKKIKKKIFRICLNSSSKDKFHQMIVFQTKKYQTEIKKNLYKDKSFILVRGKQIIRIYDKNKNIIKKFYLDKNNFICWIKKNTFYDNVTMGSQSIHIESLAGPFNRNKDRIYLK